MRRFHIFLFAFFLTASVVALARPWLVARWKGEQQLPPPQTATEVLRQQKKDTIQSKQSPVSSTEAILAEVNLAVPFTSQAPHANWDTDHNEFCEEATALMVGRFFQNRPIENKDDAEAGLQDVKRWELENLGYYYDTTAEETAKILEGVYGLNIEVKTNPTVDDIKKSVAAGKLVIVPAAGRELGNPYYRQPGPIYHMVVIRGYTKEGKFIMNDPGTRRGEGYVYDPEVVMNAMHDWVPAGDRTVPRNGDVQNGRRVILVVKRSS